VLESQYAATYTALRLSSASLACQSAASACFWW
jgi:hypothetical protein